MERLRINGTDVFLEDLGENRGKIIVSDPNAGSYSYYWGSMGSNLKEFLLRINGDYFAGKLLPSDLMYVFDGKSTVKNIRRVIKETDTLPWYEFMSAQKEMREKIKRLEFCRNEDEFIYECRALPESILCLDMEFEEETEFKDILDGIFRDEPWDLIQTKTSWRYDFLCELLKNIKKEISTSKN